MRKIAISDIHGCFLSFEALLDQLAFTTADELYLLGDYIDRGPDSKAVLDQIFSLQSQGYEIRCLKGNHEDAFQNAGKNPDLFFSWYENWGGKQTLESFDVRLPGAVPLKYLRFFKKLSYFFEVDEYILVHAGLDFRYPDPLTPSEDMLYMRDWYDSIDYDWLGDRIIVHGHTPVSKVTIENLLKKLGNYRVLDIDGGCFAKHLPGKGYLCAFDMTNRKLFFQKNLDDVSNYWRGR